MHEIFSYREVVKKTPRLELLLAVLPLTGHQLLRQPLLEHLLQDTTADGLGPPSLLEQLLEIGTGVVLAV